MISNRAITMIQQFFATGASEVLVLTTCVMGTHRSVATAEIIARQVEAWGIHVRVRHVHRRRMVGDAR